MRKEWQPRPAPITFEQVTRLAQEALLRGGQYVTIQKKQPTNRLLIKGCRLVLFNPCHSIIGFQAQPQTLVWYLSRLHVVYPARFLRARVGLRGSREV